MMTLVILLLFLLFCVLVFGSASHFQLSMYLFLQPFLFSGLLVYYSFLTLAGLVHRSRKQKDRTLEHYPSVDILIPAHNEGVVIKDTLEAMARLNIQAN